MKTGFRKPSIKKSFSARTSGRVTRNIKNSINPLYGKKGMGMINDPEKSIYNGIYNKTTIGHSNFGGSDDTGSIAVLIGCLVLFLIIGVPMLAIISFIGSIFG